MELNIGDRILKEQGLTYEDLNALERETYRQQVFNIKTLSLSDVIQNVIDMKNSIALQLCDIPDDTLNRDKNSKLKARLKNYLLLEAFLTSPERAEKALRNNLKNVKE